MTLFNNTELCTQNNGQISQWFVPARGCCQGCCSSPLVYLCCGQVLAQKIKENSNNKGIEIYDFIDLLSQFADDTNLFLSSDDATL